MLLSVHVVSALVKQDPRVTVATWQQVDAYLNKMILGWWHHQTTEMHDALIEMIKKSSLTLSNSCCSCTRKQEMKQE